jgi:hypothetical protein
LLLQIFLLSFVKDLVSQALAAGGESQWQNRNAAEQGNQGERLTDLDGKRSLWSACDLSPLWSRAERVHGWNFTRRITVEPSEASA